MEKNKIKNTQRRNFIKNASILAVSGAMVTPTISASALDRTEGKAKLAHDNGTRYLGKLKVSTIGLGCMSMTSGSYNPVQPKSEMINVIRGAFEKGVTFFDTAEVYGPFTNEEYVGEALKPIRNQVVIGSKFGFSFAEGQRGGRDARPESLRKAVEGMLKRLQTDRIDLLYLHRADPNVPIEDVAGTVRDLIQEGKALHFGLSEVSSDTIRKAHAEYPVSALQSEYSLIERAVENGILDTCEELGIGFVPWGAVNRGFLGDKFNEYSRFSEDSRFASVPYFTPEAIAQHMKVLRLVREWAMRKDITPAQFSLAWLLAQRPFIAHIPGSVKLHHIEENIGAAHVTFTTDELTTFRNELEKIELIGIRSKESVFRDQ